MNPVATVSIASPVGTRETPMAEPQWRRVAAEIRQRIRDGADLRERDGRDGRWLPTYPELEQQHRTSYGTLRTALLVLEAEGWIDRLPGVGLRVREDHPA